MPTPRKGAQMYIKSVLLKKDTLMTQEAAFLLGVAPRTVERYMEDGKLEFQLTLGGHRRALTESVKKYVR